MAVIVIGADLCPIEGNRPYFLAGDASSLFHDLLSEFEAADLVIANLECPLIESPSPILKTGPSFGEPSACLNGIKNAGVHVLCLANNHIMDHGPAGLRNTLDACDRAGLATVGAGKDLAAANRILVRRVGDLRLGIMAVAEHEFSIATRDGWGANPLDPIAFVRSVARQRTEYDDLIVLLHGGDEFHVPSPRLQDTCRFLVEMGAQAVIVQHPHCLGGYERYRGGHIVYGQGALVMDEAIYRDRESFHEGYLVRLHFQVGVPSSLEIIPFTQSNPVPGARKLAADDAHRFRTALERRSNAILDPAFVEAEWLRFCQGREHAYLSGLLGHGRILRKLNAQGVIERLVHGRKRLASARNLVCCETHQEVLQTILDRRLGLQS